MCPYKKVVLDKEREPISVEHIPDKNEDYDVTPPGHPSTVTFRLRNATYAYGFVTDGGIGVISETGDKYPPSVEVRGSFSVVGADGARVDMLHYYRQNGEEVPPVQHAVEGLGKVLEARRQEN